MLFHGGGPCGAVLLRPERIRFDASLSTSQRQSVFSLPGGTDLPDLFAVYGCGNVGCGGMRMARARAPAEIHWRGADSLEVRSDRAILQHVVMLGNFNAGQYDPVLWSLVQEMQISVIFPLLALAVIPPVLFLLPLTKPKV